MTASIENDKAGIAVYNALQRENARLTNAVRLQAEVIELLREDSDRLSWLLSEASDGNLAESEDLRVLIEQAWVLVTDCGDNYEREDKIAAIDAAMLKAQPVPAPLQTKQFIEKVDELELTDAAIRKLQAQYPTENDPLTFARAIEAAIFNNTTKEN